MKKIFSILTVFLTLAVTTVSCSSNDDAPIESSLATITDFSIAIDGVNADDIVYDLGTDIIVTVPFGTSLTAVTPTITVSENATVSPVSGAAITFVDGEAKTFTVTAEDEVTTKNYTVTINVRGEIGSGSQLETTVFADDYGFFAISTTTTYEYDDTFGFVNKISVDEGFGATVFTLVYDDKNQVIEKTTENTSTVYTYENNQIVKAEYKEEDVLVYTYNYTYNTLGYLVTEERTNHEGAEALVDDLTTFEYDASGNVIKTNRGTAQTNPSEATYDTKNNPFKGIYPAAYAAINVGFDAVNTNNPLTRDAADANVSYVYNTDDYPLESSYTNSDFGLTVNKTFTYYAN
ncbi:DUF5018 domain-containing protein [Polaribacter sp. Z014]|uniref:DUF5018 domain-containing protein n=1 Tax=Polaribacter sp. Z014 TaxID=2927126 RepID=UPI0020226572|nr:DUF5018 domain-containing protein [Polaribacter sp. Z014]MCL7764019.1 DUF5018 domain-containing protein [Polaribacter sp. Z014]